MTRKLLITHAARKFNGEIAMSLSLAESWASQGETDFDIDIYAPADYLISGKEDTDEIDAKIEKFKPRLEALARQGIQIRVFTVPNGTLYKTIGHVTDERPHYASGLIYPCPKFGRIKIREIDEAMLRCLPDSLPRKKLLLTEGLANLKADQLDYRNRSSYHATHDIYPEHIVLMQPPMPTSCVQDLARPDFVKDKPYYLLYANPLLVHPGYSAGVKYDDALSMFISDALQKRPDEDIYIYHNAINAYDEQNMCAMVSALLKQYPHLIFEVEHALYGEKKIETFNAEGAGPSVKVLVHPPLSNHDFIGLIHEAEIAALNSSGCFDEALALGKPCLLIDNAVMKRLPNMLFILKKEGHASPAGGLHTLYLFLHQHSFLTSATESVRPSIYEKLLSYFHEPLSHELAAQFKTFSTLLQNEDYDLSQVLLRALHKLDISQDYSAKSSARFFQAETSDASEAFKDEITPAQKKFKGERDELQEDELDAIETKKAPPQSGPS